MTACPEIDTSLLGLHDGLLGAPIGPLVEEAARAGALVWDVGPGDPAASCDPASARVVVTLHGVLGDSGMPTHTSLVLGATSHSRDRVLASDASYRQTLASREVLRVAPRVAVGASPCMGLAWGLDNRELLPPFFPVCRNEDGLFAAILPYCVDDALVAHLPVAVLHDARRRVNEPTLVSPVAVRVMSDLVMFALLAETRPPGPRPTAWRLERLGAHFCDLAAADPGALARFFRLQLAGQSRGFLAALAAAEARGVPAAAREDLAACRAATLAALGDAHAIVPRDLPAIGESSETFALARTLLRDYGRVLMAWPSMVAAARRLAAQGVRVSRSVAADAL